MYPKQLQTIEQQEDSRVRKTNKRYKDILRRMHHQANYISISSIPNSKPRGLNYTFMGDNLIKKTHQDEQELNEQAEWEMHRQSLQKGKLQQKKSLKKTSLKKSISTRRTNTPTKRTYQSQDIHLTIQTKNSNGSILIDRVNSNLHFLDRDRSIGSLFNNQEERNMKSNQTQKIEQYSTQQEDDDDDQEYIKDSTPGPGSYQLGSTFSTKTGKSKSLMSRLSKLPKSPLHSTKPLPLIYDIPLKTRLRKVQFKKFYPFQSSAPRFQNINNQQQNMPGPQDYRPRNTIQQDLIRNIQKDVKGKFASEQQRFKQKKLQPYPGPTSYQISPIPQVDQNINQQPQYFFKSSIKRQIFNKKAHKIPPVGTYEIQRKIEDSIDKQDEKIKPGFGTNAIRFKQDPKKQPPLDSLDLLTIDKKTLNNLYKEPLIKRTLQEKAEIDQEKSPGPGYYQSYSPSKKVFNVKYINYF